MDRLGSESGQIRKYFVVLALLVTILLAVPGSYAQSFITWTDHEKIFNPATRAYYPTVLYDANAFSGHGGNYYYKMWYSTASAGGIALAYSNDGKVWTLYGSGGDLLTLTNPHHNRVLFDTSGFGNAASGIYYKMWYWDTAQLYSINAIRYAESAGGITWVNDQAITQDANAQIIDGVGGHWNRGSYGPIWLFYSRGASNSGSNPWDYSYVMYYDATTGGKEQVALAYSTDGVHGWKLYGSGPVLPRGDPGSWDENYACHGTVLKYNGRYLMWYSGGIGYAHEGIGYAESTDGFTWTKDPSNPIQVRGGPGSWNQERDYTPMVIYDANRFSGHGDSSDFKMYYSGVSGSSYAIGYKTGALPELATMTTTTGSTSTTTTTSDPTTMYGDAAVGGIISTPNKIAILGTYVDTFGLIVAIAVAITVIMVPAASRKRDN